MIPENRAARLVWRILSPQSSWGQFEAVLLAQQRPDWNQAVSLIADEIREYAEAVFQERTESLALAQTANMIDQLDRQLAGLEAGLEQLLSEADDEDREEVPAVARAAATAPW